MTHSIISNACHDKATVCFGLSLSAIFCVLLGFSIFSMPVSAQSEGLGGIVYPVMSPRKSSDYGNRIHPIHKVRKHHNGVDLAAPHGALIRVVKDGRVVFADPYKGYGKLIVVAHSDGHTTHYGHCQEIRVQPGERVSAGQIIGTVGSSGAVTGPHLHFEVRRNGKPLDPESVIPGLGEKGRG